MCETLNILRESRAELTSQGGPLSGACKEGFYDTAQFLIERGAINHLTGDSSCQPL